jgi:hypothetical protein
MLPNGGDPGPVLLAHGLLHLIVNPLFTFFRGGPIRP